MQRSEVSIISRNIRAVQVVQSSLHGYLDYTHGVYAGDRQAAYAFVYPNLMVNRYGPWMDTNIVTPTGPESCTVRFDWWLEEHLRHDRALIKHSLADSEQVWHSHSCLPIAHLPAL